MCLLLDLAVAVMGSACVTEDLRLPVIVRAMSTSQVASSD